MALHRGLALLVAGAFFMEILDGTVLAPAAPHIAADLGVAPVDVNVAITAYVLTLGVLIPVSGWLADRYGARRVFCAALAVFVLASAACALAPNLTALTAARVAQGAGGAMMVPVGRLVVLRTTAKADLVRAIAYLTWPALLAPVLAPVVGGVLAEYASWRWIFVINVPLGLAALAVALRIVPGLRADSPPPLDRAGFALTAVGVAALVVGLEGLGSGFSPATVIALVVAAAGLALAVRHLLRAERPLVDLRILRVATYRVTAASGSVYRAVITAIPFLLPLLFQIGFGWSAAQAGAVVIALFVGNVAIKPATTPLMRRFGIRTVLLGSIAVGAACLVAMAFLQPTTPLPLLVSLLLVSGVARSTGFTAYNSVAFADVEAGRMSHANTLLSTLQELGAGLGVAVGALLVRLGHAAGGAVPVATGAAGPYRVAFVLLAVVLALPAVSALLLDRTAGDAVTGR
ncbi:MFS transporter [Pseudonocardia yuanmonensis]|uniref:MFS transporter n=1 Tax=Pseudonocardia yuanmonensis TaxID=1095914 RepID=A0ABP8WPJ7_9PSEU